MRIVVIGAGAIGGVIGGRLHQYGFPAVLVARGAHLDAMWTHGLRLEDPRSTVTLDVAVRGDVGGIDWQDGDVAMLAMKSQDTDVALRELAAVAPPELPVVCTQNGVDNERQALRRFVNVYGMQVMCPAAFLQPGVVRAKSAPVSGLFDIGRFPAGVDSTAEAVATALAGAGFDARPVGDIMRWKYGKLLMNLGNAVQVVCGLGTGTEIIARARQEGADCLDAAGIPFVSRDEDRARRGDLLTAQPAGPGHRIGSSTWQSVVRGSGSVETDYLNGEIVLLGRLHDVPTPVNGLLQRLTMQVAAGHRSPGSVSEAEFLERLDKEPVGS